MAGYHDFTAGTVLTANDLEEYCELQSTMRFASAAARDSALSVVKTEGMRAYLIDVNTETVYTGSAWSTVGPVHGALTTWTPTVTQSGTVTVTNTYSVYSRMGRRIWFETCLTVSGTGTANNDIVITLPVTAASSSVPILGWGSVQDASPSNIYQGIAYATSTTAFRIASSAGTVVGAWFGSSTSVFGLALASGDFIKAQGTYEAAADA